MHRLILILFLFQLSCAQSQQIFSATGAMVSFLDMKTTDKNDVTSSPYPTGMIRQSVALGFETPEWKHLSLTVAGSYFTSGGSRSPETFLHPSQIQFDNFCLGLSGNYYVVDSKTQFYIGIGPRLDYVRSDEEVYFELLGDSYSRQAVRVFKVGITGSIGVNFQLDRVNLGIKSNYYYRPNLLNRDFSTKLNIWGGSNPYKNITLRDYAFDLQLVIGYRFGKRNKQNAD